MSKEELSRLIEQAVSNKAAVIIVNNNNYNDTYNNAISPEDAQALLDLMRSEEASDDSYRYQTEEQYESDKVRYELVGLGIRNLMEWMHTEERSLYNCIAKAAIQDDCLVFFVHDINIMSYVNDMDLMHKLSEQIILKTGLKRISLKNMRGETFWEADCVTASTPLRPDIFNALPVVNKENTSEENTEDDYVQKEFIQVMSGRSINLEDFLKKLPREMKESSIPVLLAVEALKHASADWYKNEFRTTDTPKEDLMSRATDLFNESVENIIHLCKD